jgi:predicted ABC-type ATPase
MKKPILYIIAGPNGSGKTTFAREYLPLYAKCKNYINADLIAQGLSPFSPQTSAIHAGRLVLKQINDFSNRKIDFGFETTLSGKTYFSLMF